jgi:hypothetical protein
MPTEVYKTHHVDTIDGLDIEIIPLKIKYLKEVMDDFMLVDDAADESDTINVLSECVRISMKQYEPKLSNSIDTIQDTFDLSTIYKILEFGAGLKLNKTETIANDNYESNDSESKWENLDLAKLEAEVFLLGIWKNFDELEASLCIEELMQILSTTRELSYEEKKFSAALQGVDLDGESSNEVKGQQEWENLKARVYSGGATNDANDILALQGVNAQKAGFGIGMGLGYESLIDESKLIKK